MQKKELLIKLEQLISLKNPGDSLPSENELAADYDVSRGMIRSALVELANLGKINSHQGKGWQISFHAPLPSIWLSLHNYSFTAELRRKKFQPINEVVAGPTEASAHQIGSISSRIDVAAVFERLRLSGDSRIIWFERVRSGKDETNGTVKILALQYALLVAEHIKVPVDRQSLTEPGGLSRIMDESGLTDREPLPAAYPSYATDREASLLRMRPGAAVLCVNTVNRVKRKDFKVTGEYVNFEFTTSIYSTNAGLDVTGEYEMSKRIQ